MLRLNFHFLYLLSWFFLLSFFLLILLIKLSLSFPLVFFGSLLHLWFSKRSINFFFFILLTLFLFLFILIFIFCSTEPFFPHRICDRYYDIILILKEFINLTLYALLIKSYTIIYVIILLKKTFWRWTILIPKHRIGNICIRINSIFINNK